jgi:polysaccharide biosynthesis transport protein
MELRDYLRMLRRGWPTVLLVTALTLGLAAAYLAVAPKRYQAEALVLLSARTTGSVTDLQQGSQFAVNAAPTYADILDSAQVLGPVAGRLRPTVTVRELEDMVDADARELTGLIDVTATAGRPDQAAAIANAVANTAVENVPALTPTRLGSSRSLVNLQIVRVAPEPDEPLSPNTPRVLALGLVVGLALGLGLTIAGQALNTRLRRPEDLRQVTDTPLLAVLPRLRRSQRGLIVVRDDPLSPAVETYRSLRTNLSYLEAGGRRSLLFTSVAEDHEDVQVPVNLAWSLAQAGRRVLLVDLDLRHSLIGDLLQLRGGPGMADVLAEGGALSDVVHRTGQADLFVVLSGTTQPSPSDLLSTPAMENVLRAAEKEYDYVVLHAPPILTYSDAAVVSRVAGQTLVTVAARQTKSAKLVSALGALANVGVEPLGLVLAGSRSSAGDATKVRGRSRPPSAGPSRPVLWDLADGHPSPPARRIRS